MSDDSENLGALIAENSRRLAESREKLAYLQGQQDASIDEMGRDAGMRETLRALAWARAGRTVYETAGGSYQMPGGWPEGVDGEEFIAEELGRERAARRLLDDGRPPAARPAGPLVERFRGMLK